METCILLKTRSVFARNFTLRSTEAPNYSEYPDDKIREEIRTGRGFSISS